MHTKRTLFAFSLVELSIVLVILGLLTGGILAGQSLIRASELRAVTTEYQRYVAAIGSFRDKYFAVPGDFSRAADFGWKDAAGTSLTNAGGNGSGLLDFSTTATSNEISTVWIHLTNAGLVEGSYTNIAATSTTAATMTAGTNNPRSKLNTAGWNIIGLGNIASAGAYWVGNYGNALILHTSYSGNIILPPTTGPSSSQGVMKAEEAWNIDTKLDDGKSEMGLVNAFRTQQSATTGCGDTANGYTLSNTASGVCSLIMKTGY